MPDFVYVNGEFKQSFEAVISVFDHGFLYGDGLFETMRSYRGRIFLLGEHLKRLKRSSEVLKLNIPDLSELEKALEEIIKFNGDNLYIRLTVSRGPGPVGIDPGLCPKPTVVITSKEIGYNERMYCEGATAIFVRTLRNLAGATLPDVKSLNFLNNILAKQEVIAAGADEGFMLNHLGQVTEGSVSNVFMVKSGCLITPSPEAGLLMGITRQKILELARMAGMQVKEEILYQEHFSGAEEIFYTNSGSEIVPVVTLDGRPVGTGRVGPVAAEMLCKYRSLAWGIPGGCQPG